MMRRKHLVPATFIVVIAFSAGIFFATAGSNFFGQEENTGSDVFASSPASGPVGPKSSLEEAFIEVAATINPAVVQLRPRTGSSQGQQNSPFGGAPFNSFFSPERGVGSGVIITSDGYIVTNNHVVESASDIIVVFEGGQTLEAEVVGADPYVDIAVLKVDGKDLPVISFGNAEDVKIGQWVMAFGSPLSEDLNNTVTAGIVSGNGRVSSLNLGAELIQTDAVINPGNSGGPLVDLQGRMIGINTLIASRTGVYNGIGFAVPVNTVQNAVEQLINTGLVRRGFLGITFDQVPQPLVEALNIPPGSAQVTGVLDGESASKAGVLAGDIITSINGEVLRNFSHLRTRIGAFLPEETITLKIIREDESFEVDVRLGDHPNNLVENEPPKIENNDNDSFQALGLTLQDFDPEDAKRSLDLAKTPDFRGAIIQSVAPNSDASQDARLMPYDIITEAGEQTVESVQDFQRIVNSLESGENARDQSDTIYETERG